MKGLSAALLGQACRTFLALAYPEGNIPSSRCLFLNIQPDAPLEPLLVPPVCQPLPAPDGGVRGYALRLGSVGFPHMKLQVIDCGQAMCVFGVDTHDALILEPTHPDAARWAELQATNRRVKEEIERAWEAEGLKTFNGLLREGLEQPVPSSSRTDS